jgi:hypothetical protein
VGGVRPRHRGDQSISRPNQSNRKIRASAGKTDCQEHCALPFFARVLTGTQQIILQALSAIKFQIIQDAMFFSFTRDMAFFLSLGSKPPLLFRENALMLHVSQLAWSGSFDFAVAFAPAALKMTKGKFLAKGSKPRGLGEKQIPRKARNDNGEVFG